mgnify:CR=1 FL=1
MKKISKHTSPFFIIRLPNNKLLLYRCEATYWYEMTDIVKYFKDEYGDTTTLIAVTKRDARKFMRGKFNANK